jgi:hypothetical protein
VQGSNLILVDKVLSGGAEPNAVAQYGNLVYVINVGGSSNVVGLRLSADGRLTQIPTSSRFLTTNNSEAASLYFSPTVNFSLPRSGQRILMLHRVDHLRRSDAGYQAMADAIDLALFQ